MCRDAAGFSVAACTRSLLSSRRATARCGPAATTRGWSRPSSRRSARGSSSACRIGPGTRVLDVAAGTGNASIPAAERGAHGHRLRPHARAAARPAAARTDLDIEWVEADAEALPVRGRVLRRRDVRDRRDVRAAPSGRRRRARARVRAGRDDRPAELDARGHARRAVPHDGPVRAAAASRRVARRRCGAAKATCAGSSATASSGSRCGARCSRSPRFARRARLRRAVQGPLRPDDRRPRQRRAQRPRRRVRRRPGRLLRRVEPRPATASPRASRWSTCSPSAPTPNLKGTVPFRVLSRGASSRRASPSTAETWWSTVFGEITSASAISAFVAPVRSCASTSDSRGVSPPASRGWRAAARAGSGARRSARSCAAQMRGDAGRAEPVVDRRAPRRRPASRERARGLVREPDRAPTPRPPRASRRRPRARTARGRRGAAGTSRARARRSQKRHLGPRAHALVRARRRSAYAACRLRARLAASRASARGASQPARALASRGRRVGAMRAAGRAAGARRSRPRRARPRRACAPASGSPRRACSRPSATRAGQRLTPGCSPSAREARASASAAAPVAAEQAQVRAHAERVLGVAVELALAGERQRRVEVGVHARVVAAARERRRWRG